jgi:hypothetical protein
VLRDGSLVQAYRNRAQQRIETYYAWDKVVDQYEQLFARMCGQAPPPAPPTEAAETTRILEKQLKPV